MSWNLLERFLESDHFNRDPSLCIEYLSYVANAHTPYIWCVKTKTNFINVDATRNTSASTTFSATSSASSPTKSSNSSSRSYATSSSASTTPLWPLRSSCSTSVKNPSTALSSPSGSSRPTCTTSPPIRSRSTSRLRDGYIIRCKELCLERARGCIGRRLGRMCCR